MSDITLINSIAGVEYDGPFAQYSAATQTFPYWVIWEPVQDNGHQKVYYFHKDMVNKVAVEGPVGKEESDDGSVPQDQVSDM